MPNQSKINDPRFWELWEKSGAISVPFTDKDDKNIANAKIWLNLARNRTSDNSYCIEYIREYLANAKASLKRIGTNEVEIAQLLIDGYIAHATKWLNLARNRTGDNSNCIEYIREYLKKANAPLKCIGTNETEMAQLLVDCDSAENAIWSECARVTN